MSSAAIISKLTFFCHFFLTEVAFSTFPDCFAISWAVGGSSSNLWNHSQWQARKNVFSSFFS